VLLSNITFLLWPPCEADADIIFLSCLFRFFLACISAVADWMSTMAYFYTWCGLREFRMQVWNLVHAARWKCRTQKIAKNWPSAWAPYRRALSSCGLSLQRRHVLTMGKTCF